jgi:hypothetical protein
MGTADLVQIETDGHRWTVGLSLCLGLGDQNGKEGLAFVKGEAWILKKKERRSMSIEKCIIWLCLLFTSLDRLLH